MRVPSWRKEAHRLVARMARHADFVVPATVHVVAVGLMFALLVATRGTEGLWHGMTATWDAEIYVRLADEGYRGTSGVSDYAFPPLWPSLLSLLGDLRLAWAATLLLGALGTGLVGCLVGWRGGVLFAVVPTWLWFSSVLYTEALFVATAAGGLVAARLGRYWLAGTCVALAVLTRYVGAVGLAAALGYTLWGLRREPGVRVRAALGLFAPVAAVGVGILVWHARATGSAWVYFDAQEAWGAELRGPRAQVEWILHGWFTNQEVVRDSLPPAHWLYRNLVVEAAVVGGTVLLWLRGHRALALYSAAIVAVVVSTVGMPSISVPRLALAAFPAWAALGARLHTASLVWVVAAGIAAGTWVGSLYLGGFFA